MATTQVIARTGNSISLHREISIDIKNAISDYLHNRSQADSVSVSKNPRYVGDLTPREKEVKELVIEGMGNKDIGNTLNLSINTVKHHLVCIYSKEHIVGHGQRIKLVMKALANKKLNLKLEEQNTSCMQALRH